jgi:murein DD-endopeptidase MepM/ murein hydrolase activator NlpD
MIIGLIRFNNFQPEHINTQNTETEQPQENNTLVPDKIVTAETKKLENKTEFTIINSELPITDNITLVSPEITPEETQETKNNKEFIWTPNEWEPDPDTWNMTSKLPAEASPVRLSFPVPIESLYGKRWAGIGGMGLHAGGRIEGLDHVWIESTTTEPIKSWANGTVEWIELSGDIEHAEYHIGINYGRNLLGVHMEIETPLVEKGDFVERGAPIGYGMAYFEGL